MSLEIATAITALLQAVPSLQPLMTQFMAWLATVNGSDPGTAVSNSGVIIANLMNAKTKDDYANSAKAIADMLSKPMSS